MTIPAIDLLVREEQTTDQPPDDWPTARRIRHALLHGEPISTADVPLRFSVAGNTLSTAAEALARVGFHVQRERLPQPVAGRGRPPIRYSVTNLDHVPTAAKQRATSRTSAAKVPATVPQRPWNQRRADEREELARLRDLHRDAPVVPPLGTVVRVSMIAEDNGSAVVVLAGMDGARWFARMEGTDHGS